MKKTLIAYFAGATAAMAHPGHGAGPDHWLTQADHRAVLVGLAVIGIAALIALRSRE